MSNITNTLPNRRDIVNHIKSVKVTPRSGPYNNSISPSNNCNPKIPIMNASLINKDKMYKAFDKEVLLNLALSKNLIEIVRVFS
jgi:hypothetical protein